MQYEVHQVPPTDAQDPSGKFSVHVVTFSQVKCEFLLIPGHQLWPEPRHGFYIYAPDILKLGQLASTFWE